MDSSEGNTLSDLGTLIVYLVLAILAVVLALVLVNALGVSDFLEENATLTMTSIIAIIIVVPVFRQLVARNSDTYQSWMLPWKEVRENMLIRVAFALFLYFVL